MTYLGQARAEDANQVWAFLTNQLRCGHLFRGNLTYISEALLEADPNSGADVYRRLYLGRIQDMDSRVARVALDPRDEAPTRSRCIYDVKQVRRLADQIPLADVRAVRRLYVSGVDDVDLHRSLAFVLRRTRPGDSGGLETVVEALRSEVDQTNAYYVTRYIMKWGQKEAPKLLSKTTLDSLRGIARRWPQNTYFAQSASRLAAKLRAS